MFSGIFMHRYRDVRAEIRKICIFEMGEWMKNYSQYFLDENYLKYFGWTLFDKVGDVRLQVLNALEELYQNEDFLDKLELFTGRFQNRIVHMTLDVEKDVAVKAIKLTTLLYKYDVLEEEDCSQVEQLVFCDQRRIAHAAGEFLALRIIRLSLAASPRKIKGSKEQYLQQMNIKAILEFFIKTEIHQHCTYIVDSLWEHTDILKDWKALTNLLLHQNSMIDLDDQEESALIDLMCCACTQAATGVAPAGRNPSKKANFKDKKIIEDDRTSLSIHFMEHLPSLVEKYKADVSKTKALLTLPQHFNLDLYAEKRLTKNLEKLLEHMEDIILKTADSELLDACSVTYHVLVQNDSLIHQTVEISRNRLFDGVFEKFKKSLIHGVPTEDANTKTQGYFNMMTGLKRILAFSKNHEMTDWDVYEDINSIIEHGAKGNVDDEVLKLSIHIMFQLFLQKLCSFDPEEPEKAELKSLRKQQKVYIRQLDDLLQFGSPEIKNEVFKIFCDFYMFFPKQLLNKEQKFGQIVCQPASDLQVRMRDYVISHVFNEVADEDQSDDENDENEEDDSKAKELSEKRELLAGLCKLITYEIFDIRLAAPIYAQFVKAFADYSDIIKELMHRCKENDIIKFSKVLLYSLQQVFEELRDDENGEIDTRSDDFIKVKDLAKKFALLLGVNTNADSTRKSTIIIHREGINYAFSYPVETTRDDQQVPGVPPNLLFFEILHEFSYKISKTDRKVVIKHLNDLAGDRLTTKGNDWSPLRAYRASLEGGVVSGETTVDGEAEHELRAAMALEKKKAASNKKTPKATTNKKQTAAAKKKLSMSRVGKNDTLVNKTTTIPEESEEEDEEEEASTTPKVAKGIPKLNKSSDETSSSNIDFQKTKPKGSTAQNAVKLTTDTSSAETGDNEDGEGDEASDIESESDLNSTVVEDKGTTTESSKKSWLSPTKKNLNKTPILDYTMNTSNQKRKKLELSTSQDSPSDISDVSDVSNINTREMRAAKRQKRGSNVADDSMTSETS